MIKQVVDQVAAFLESRTSRGDWPKQYGPGPSPRPSETACAKSLQASGFLTEVGKTSVMRGKHRDTELRLGKGALLKAFEKLEKDGWGSTWRIDAIKDGKSPIIVEMKFSKFDVIRGRNGGRCIWDIGQWAKDLTRLERIKVHMHSAKCWFVLGGVWRNKCIPKAHFDAFRRKLNAEWRNDLRRDCPELKEPYPYRKQQRRVLKKLMTMERRDVRMRSGEKWVVLAIPVWPKIRIS